MSTADNVRFIKMYKHVLKCIHMSTVGNVCFVKMYVNGSRSAKIIFI